MNKNKDIKFRRSGAGKGGLKTKGNGDDILSSRGLSSKDKKKKGGDKA